MFNTKLAGGLGILVLSIFGARGAVIFEDSFDDAATSATFWNGNSEDVVVNFDNGVCTAKNNNATFAGLVYHIFENKPSTFTLSGKVNTNSADINAGFYFCLNIIGSVTGYSVQLGSNNYVFVFKYTTGNPVQLLSVQSPYLLSGTNNIKVSKSGSNFNIFCNGYFAGSFEDSELSSGDIAMLIPPGGTAIYDNIVMTDQFESGSALQCFSDDFNSGNLLGWAQFGDDALISLSSGALGVATGDGEFYINTSVSLENFIVRIVASHRSGSKTSLYGLFLRGEAETSIPIAGFTISGSSRYGTYLAGQSLSLYQSSVIKGDAYVSSEGAVTYFHDTLEISKQPNTGYIFKVNKVALDTMESIPFAITGAGIYVSDSLDIRFDNFVAAEGTDGECTPLTVWNPVNFAKPGVMQPQKFIFDPLGRVIPGVTNFTDKKLSTGIYLKKGHKALILQKQ